MRHPVTGEPLADNAIIRTDRQGRLHYARGPAIVSGTRKEWWVHGVRHREGNEPAIEDENGLYAFYVNGQLHSTVGPAYVRYNDNEAYVAHYVNGKLQSLVEEGVVLPCVIVVRPRGYVTLKYYDDGQLHRDIGPAFMRVYKGRLMMQAYAYRGKLHRLGGPAIINLFLRKCRYFIHGRPVTEEEAMAAYVPPPALQQQSLQVTRAVVAGD